MVKLVVTRGVEGATAPNCWVQVSPVGAGARRQRETGIDVILLDRGYDSDAAERAPWLLLGAKTLSYAVNMAAQQEARRRGSDDALFLSLEGLVLEGPTSNIWFREGRTLHTPALDLGILAGVTRDTPDVSLTVRMPFNF